MATSRSRLVGAEGLLDLLKSLPAELVSKSGGPVRKALRLGARVLVDEARMNVRRIVDTPNVDDEASRSTGLLQQSIREKVSKPSGNQKGEAFVIGIRRNQKYPAFRQARNEVLTAAQIGRQLEYGTADRPPMPWLRPAFDSKKEQAVNVTIADLRARITAIIAKLERTSRRRR